MNASSPGVGLGNLGLLQELTAIKSMLANQCLSKAGLTIGSVSTAKVKIANTVTYSNNGNTATALSATPTIGVIPAAVTTVEVAFTASAANNVVAPANTVVEQCFILTLDNTSGGNPTLWPGLPSVGAGTALWPAPIDVVGAQPNSNDNLPLPPFGAAAPNPYAGHRYGTVIGGVRIAVTGGGSGVTFTAGTTALSASGVSATYYDFNGVYTPNFTAAQ